MRRFPALVVLVTAAAGCIAASACLTWDLGSSPCEGFVSNQQEVSILGSWACAIAAEGHVTSATTNVSLLTGEMCDKVCGPGFGNCQLPPDYIQAYLAAQPDAASDAGPGAPGQPADSGDGDGEEPASDAEAGSPLICPHALDSQQFIIVCANSC
jgi:hypothetical protein